MRTCKDCKIEKQLSEFHIQGKSKRTGEFWHRRRCKKCHNLRFQPSTGIPNIGRFKKGNAPTAGFKKGNIPWIKGKKIPIETIEKMAAKKRGSGKSRNSWNAREWKRKVFEKDDYKCTKCSSVVKIHAHHIKDWDNFPELRFDEDNGVTLCHSCHSYNHGKMNCCVTNGNRFKIAQIPWNKGKKMSIESRKKMSDARKGQIPWNKKYSVGNITVV